MHTTSQASRFFTRTPLTWLGYMAFTLFAYLQSAFSIAIPFLRRDLNISYALAGFHTSAYAFGLIAAGPLMKLGLRFTSRRFVFWGSALAMTLCCIAITMVSSSTITLIGAGSIGLFGGILLAMGQVVLSTAHGSGSSAALMEGHFIASTMSLLAPLGLGTFEAHGLGWRTSLWLGLPMLALSSIYLFRVLLIFPKFHKENDLRVENRKMAQEKQSSKRFENMCMYILLTIAVSSEWCFFVWGTEFIAETMRIARSAAAQAMTGYTLAYVLGRLGGSIALKRKSPSSMLSLTFLLALVCSTIACLTPIPGLAMFGFYLAGIAISNFFPLITAVLLERSSNRDHTASSISISIGTAIVSAPLILGWLSDKSSPKESFIMVVPLISLSLSLVFFDGFSEKNRRKQFVSSQ